MGYTGHKFDTDLGLSYMQARYYDPVIGRFYSNYPVGYVAKNPVHSFGRYTYVTIKGIGDTLITNLSD